MGKQDCQPFQGILENKTFHYFMNITSVFIPSQYRKNFIKLNPVLGYAVGDKCFKEEGDFLYVLIDVKNNKDIKTTISFLEKEGFLYDYYHYSHYASNLRMVVLDFEDPIRTAIYNFKKGQFSKMLDKESRSYFLKVVGKGIHQMDHINRGIFLDFRYYKAKIQELFGEVDEDALLSVKEMDSFELEPTPEYFNEDLVINKHIVKFPIKSF